MDGFSPRPRPPSPRGGTIGTPRPFVVFERVVDLAAGVLVEALLDLAPALGGGHPGSLKMAEDSLSAGMASTWRLPA